MLLSLILWLHNVIIFSLLTVFNLQIDFYFIYLKLRFWRNIIHDIYRLIVLLLQIKYVLPINKII